MHRQLLLKKKSEVKILKTSRIDKSFKSDEVTQEQIEKISKYTRREMSADELFIFSVILCDNEIDRDGEKFTKESLEKLSLLFLGKTGIFDHIASSENQSARIFDCTVISDDTKTTDNDDYFALKAFAYMVRCEKTNDLILEIDAGIKKEVSVGCAVEKVLCSVCGTDIKSSHCEHAKGNIYSGVHCHHLLINPTDAYEWSFVAVPAQKNAGVTKSCGESISNTPLYEKIYKSDKPVNLSLSEIKSLRKHIEALEGLSRYGSEYAEDIKKRIIKNAGISQPEMDLSVLEKVCESMSITELKAFDETYEKLSKKKDKVIFQLEPLEKRGNESQNQFKI